MFAYFDGDVDFRFPFYVYCFLKAGAHSSQTELEVLRQIAAAAKNDAESDADADGCLWFCSGFSLALGGGCLLGSLSLDTFLFASTFTSAQSSCRETA